MIYVFEDLSSTEERFKITANSEEEAILIAIKGMLNRGDITVTEICTNLDISLVEVESLQEYE